MKVKQIYGWIVWLVVMVTFEGLKAHEGYVASGDLLNMHMKALVLLVVTLAYVVYKMIDNRRKGIS